jgi:2-polyprenyl-3-methyl-5-hydroxy-6-metoxy-1,4-benzoquinol methylase
MQAPLTARQERELAYHRDHARQHQAMIRAPFFWGVLQNPGRRWWNAYWAMYAYLMDAGLKGRQVLVVGCGFGDDALRLAKLGAEVSAFDLSPEALDIARALAAREGLTITFDRMPAERMRYDSNRFDCIVCRDILHHVDIPATMQEIERVAKPGALLVVNEIYSHSITERVRRSGLVERVLYPKMRRMIYGADRPYITEDERKLDETDLARVRAPLGAPVLMRHFNFLVTRVVPDRFEPLAKLDRLLLKWLRPLAPVLAGRVLFAAPVAKGGGAAP